jgi:hypothetical protein
MVDNAHASQTPANAKIPIAKTGGRLDTGWIPIGVAYYNRSNTWSQIQTFQTNIDVGGSINAEGGIDLSQNIGGGLELITDGGGIVAGHPLSSHGSGSFSTTDTADTLLISGALTTDFYFLTPRGSTITSNDVLSATAKTDTLIVSRPASGTSGLGYNYFRIRW